GAGKEQLRETFVRTGEQAIRLIDENLAGPVEVFSPRDQCRDSLAKLCLDFVELRGVAALHAEAIGTLLLCVEHSKLRAQAELGQMSRVPFRRQSDIADETEPSRYR